ncbi:SDR family oxidoreductase [Roseococcus pinisoli]|uniref:SDR family NAD(P)-dependent oxidoreductase n=1 Tax=Roseococcus pinisoli TaxID=2835040 RepID=A0ABS5QG72_9PROT|nr:SDR family NAD(P)-dependent oxidoreductase [Roseococcus pinisoli]MBS7812697.1 SDR family NAD(P)-dependent oxidoreductase [Roseococcus pinisoli]
MGTLEGKIVWITGGGTGIGLAGAKALAEAGAKVILSGRRPEVLEEAIAGLPGATAMPLDVSDAAGARDVAERILAAHGRIDILINSAGLNVPRRTWAEVSTDGWDTVRSVNTDGTFYCIAAALPAMRRQKDGLVVNVASWAGKHFGKMTGPAYTSAKHAVVAMTHSLNMEEWSNGIRATVICPAEVNTPILDTRPAPPSQAMRARMLQADDLGRTIRFVCEMPAHVCTNEIVLSPVWNRSFGATDPAATN